MLRDEVAFLVGAVGLAVAAVVMFRRAVKHRPGD